MPVVSKSASWSHRCIKDFVSYLEEVCDEVTLELGVGALADVVALKQKANAGHTKASSTPYSEALKYKSVKASSNTLQHFSTYRSIDRRPALKVSVLVESVMSFAEDYAGAEAGHETGVDGVEAVEEAGRPWSLARCIGDGLRIGSSI